VSRSSPAALRRFPRAFDGCGRGKLGLFQAASGGTVLLDEARLLEPSVRRGVVKALQRGGVHRIGSTRLEPADVWVVASTASCDPDPELENGRRWHDLFAPLVPLTLTTPPLRERDDDVLLLAEHCLARYGAEYGRTGMTLSEDARSVLRAYPWPGNVRQLCNVLEREILLSATDRIEAEQLLSTGIRPRGDDHGMLGATGGSRPWTSRSSRPQAD
jgi:DNA-binding NtrC family response regulator